MFVCSHDTEFGAIHERGGCITREDGNVRATCH